MINVNFIRWAVWVVYPLDVVLFFFMQGRLADLFEIYWIDSDQELFRGVTSGDLVASFLALVFFFLLVGAWYSQLEKNEVLSDSEEGSHALNAIRSVFMIAVPLVVLSEAGVTYLLFTAEYSNPFRTAPVGFAEQAIHIAVSIVFALGHLVLSYITACGIYLNVRTETDKDDLAILHQAQDAWPPSEPTEAIMKGGKE